MTREQGTRAELRFVLALGSNLGDREAILRAAVGDIAAIDGVELGRVSTLVETPALKPEGVDRAAPAYLNAVLLVRSALEPQDLLRELNDIERRHGRVRDIHWGDRTLDIDIVSAGELTVDTPTLTIPHPRAAGRAFVLVPWVEVEPDATLPGHGPIAALLADLEPRADDDAIAYPAEPLA